MQESKEIEDLIKELTDLRLREEQVIDKLQRAYRAATQENSRARNEGDGTSPRPPALKTPNVFSKDDRVRIRNKARKPSSAKPNYDRAREYYATVTFVDKPQDRIYITTDNGTATWRRRKNLGHLQYEPSYYSTH